MRIGVIGLGAMGWNHARVAASLGVLGGVADPRAEALQKASLTYEAPTFESARDLLRSDVDGIVVATPTSTHHELAMAALEAGKHVLVEKPIASTQAQARELVRTAEELGLTLAVGHIERHNPVVSYAREALERGALGELLSINARRVSQFPGRIRDVGCILDIGIHEIDLVRYLAGSPIVEVNAMAGSHRAEGFEDHALMLLRCENGVSATIQTNWMTPMRVRRNTLTCTSGLMELDYMEQSASVSSAQYASPDPGHYPPQVEYNDQRVVLTRQEPLLNEVRDFVRAVETRSEPLVTGDDGVRALCVAEAALRSARERRTVHFVEDEAHVVEALLTR